MVATSTLILDTLLETLEGLFADKLIEDDREPILTFELPFVESEQGSMWALYPPKLHLWHQLIMVSCVACQLIVSCLSQARFIVP